MAAASLARCVRLLHRVLLVSPVLPNGKGLILLSPRRPLGVFFGRDRRTLPQTHCLVRKSCGFLDTLEVIESHSFKIENGTEGHAQVAPLSTPLTIPPKCPATAINNTVASARAR